MLLCLLVMNAFGGTINTMLLGGMALVLSRLIDNSVVVLENIVRFMEEGAPPDRPRRRRLGSLARRPRRHRRYLHRLLSRLPAQRRQQVLFTDLALGVVISIFASYFFSMTLVPLFCAKFINLQGTWETRRASTNAVNLSRASSTASTSTSNACPSLRATWPTAR